MMSMPSPTRRRVSVHVVDVNLNPFVGAEIAFKVDGTPAGSVQASIGRAMMEVLDVRAIVEVAVTVLGETQSAVLNAGEDVRTFQFQYQSPTTAPSVGAPVARCANGATGQPCVDCTVAGRIVHICP